MDHTNYIYFYFWSMASGDKKIIDGTHERELARGAADATKLDIVEWCEDDETDDMARGVPCQGALRQTLLVVTFCASCIRMLHSSM